MGVEEEVDALLEERFGRAEVDAEAEDEDGNRPGDLGGATDVGSSENRRVKLIVFLGRFKDVNVALGDVDSGVARDAGRHISQAMEP